MRDCIRIQTHKDDAIITDIAIDNSTGFKDFSVSETRLDIVKDITLKIWDDDDGSKILKIGDISLEGLEIELLKEFINQA